MMQMMKALVAAMLVSLLVGCAQIQARQESNALMNTLETYRKAIRWGYFETAANYRRPRQAQVHELDPASLKDVRVVSYEMSDPVLVRDRHEAHVTAMIGYYRSDSGALRQIRQDQTWWYSGKEKHWLLDGDLPDFSH